MHHKCKSFAHEPTVMQYHVSSCMSSVCIYVSFCVSLHVSFMCISLHVDVFNVYVSPRMYVPFVRMCPLCACPLMRMSFVGMSLCEYVPP